MTLEPCDIYLEKPRMEGKRLVYSWNENPLFGGRSFWIEYPDIAQALPSLYELCAPYLPVCAAIAAFGNVRVHLPIGLENKYLEQWRRAIGSICQAVYRRCSGFELVNGSGNVAPSEWPGDRTALLFGGGVESLLCLARFRQQNIKPVLVSFCGPNWNGSIEEKNPHKFELDARVSRELGLECFKIRTSFREVFRSHDAFWQGLLAGGAWNIMTSAIFSLLLFTFIWPVAGRLGIRTVVGGNEKEDNIGTFFFSFSKAAASLLKGLHPGLNFELHLTDLWKAEIARELFTQHTDMLKYQYSCLSNERERWCHCCEKCFRNYLFYKTYGIDPAVGGLNEARIKRNLANLIWQGRWVYLSRDPAAPGDYEHMLHEAEKMNAREAVEILKKICDRRLVFKFLNFLRELPFVQLWRKPLKKFFYFLLGKTVAG